MTNVERAHSNQSGYSIVELLFVVGLMALVASMAIVQINVSRPGLKGDAAMRIVLGQITQARENAIRQRRFMRVVLTAPNLIQIVREDTTTTTTTLSSVLIEGGAQFALVNSLPDTPDKFGNGAAIAFGLVTNVKFSPEGLLVNQDGASANGTAFLAIANQALSARAVTILGSTGRIRGYRWDGSKWSRV